MCAALVRRGAAVVVADLDQNKAEETVAQITEEGGRATSAAVDVSVEDQVQHLLDATVSRYGRLDYLFRGSRDQDGKRPETARREPAVTWHGVLHGTRAAYTQMAKQGFGHIVNISSFSVCCRSRSMPLTARASTPWWAYRWRCGTKVPIWE